MYSTDATSISLNRLPPHGGSGLKYPGGDYERFDYGSPSTRREWIEIAGIQPRCLSGQRLPPHGGSGLKCETHAGAFAHDKGLPPHGGSGLK